MSKLANRVSFQTLNGGTGPFIYGTSRPSFLNLKQAQTLGEINDGDAVSYIAQDQLVSPEQAEWGMGTYQASTNSILRTIVTGWIDSDGSTGTGSPLRFATAPVVSLTALAIDIGGGTSFPPMIDSGIVYVPGLTSGSSYTVANGVWHVIFNGTVALNAITITLPSTPFNGQIVHIETMQPINGLVVLPNAGQIVNDFPQTFNQYSFFEATYDSANTTWYLEFFENLIAPNDITWYINSNVNATSPGGTNNPGWGVGNDANNGLAITSPFQTLQHAWNTMIRYDWNGHQPTFKLADGDYSAGLNATSSPTNVGGGNGAVQIYGNNGSSSNVNFLDQWFIGGGITCLIQAADITWTQGSAGMVNPANGSFFGVQNGHFLKFISTATHSSTSGPWPFFFDLTTGEVGGIFLGSCTINVVGQFWGGFLNCDGSASFQMFNTTVNLPAVMDVSSGAFIQIFGGSFSLSGITWSNFGGVTGPNVITGFYTGFITTNAKFSDIPGSSGPILIDSTVSYGSAGISFPGPPSATVLTATQITPQCSQIFVDTSHRAYLIMNDQGTLRAKQINRQPNVQTASYTLAFLDQDGRVNMSVAGANTLTVPTHGSVPFPVGTEIKVTQIGAGTTTVTAAGGVTGNNFGALTQWQTAVVTQTAINVWMQTGA